jgi:hypothetical protein
MTDEQRPGDPAVDGKQEPEPDATGTVFVMVLFLMATVALWGIMYLRLIGR